MLHVTPSLVDLTRKAFSGPQSKLSLGIIALWAAALACEKISIAQESVTVLKNADIVTMDEKNPRATAMAYSGKKLIAVGDEAGVLAQAGKNVTILDLAGKTVTPGFFETHDHMVMASGTLLFPSVTPFTTPTLAEALEKFSKAEPNQDGWVLAFGADQQLYKEGRGPTREELDKIFPDHPALIFHLSGHGGFVNSQALKRAGIDENTPNPQGGFFERDKDGRLTGYLAGQPALFKVMSYPMPTLETAREAARNRAAHGITTASDFSVMNGQVLDLMVALTKSGDLAVRLVGGLFVTAPDFEATVPKLSQANNELLRVPFIKTWTDGSIQGGTGNLKGGYYDPSFGGGGAQGTQETFNAQVLRMYQLGLWPAVHANGDAAVDVALNAIEYAQEKSGMPAGSRIRPQLIHSQVTTEAQIERMAKLGVSPTFFVTHVYYFGDLHATRTLGPERINRLNAMADAFRYNVNPSMHNDPEVTPADPILNMWIAVNRKSSSGKVYGKEQAITPAQALAAYTINGAYQFGMEKETGSLEKGKLADFVVLDKNPLKVDPDSIRDIKILATVLLGRQTFNGGVELKP